MHHYLSYLGIYILHSLPSIQLCGRFSFCFHTLFLASINYGPITNTFSPIYLTFPIYRRCFPLYCRRKLPKNLTTNFRAISYQTKDLIFSVTWNSEWLRNLGGCNLGKLLLEHISDISSDPEEWRTASLLSHCGKIRFPNFKVISGDKSST